MKKDAPLQRTILCKLSKLIVVVLLMYLSNSFDQLLYCREIFEFLEKVEQSANDALSVVTNTTPQTIPK